MEALSHAAAAEVSPVCVLLSGGMDSAVCLHWAIERFGRASVFALAVDYGQRHRRELVSARRIAHAAGVELVERMVAVPWGSSQLTGARADADSPVVPGRNAILAILAAAEVTARGGAAVVMGCCADDALGFPDCRAGFVRAAERMLSEAFDVPLALHAPFLERTKPELLTDAIAIDGALEAVGLSWSCYRPRSAGARGPIPCQGCHACEVRAAAFDALGLLDAGRR